MQNLWGKKGEKRKEWNGEGGDSFNRVYKYNGWEDDGRGGDLEERIGDRGLEKYGDGSTDRLNWDMNVG